MTTTIPNGMEWLAYDSLQALAHKIAAFDAILLEKDEYEELLNEWSHEGPSPV